MPTCVVALRGVSCNAGTSLPAAQSEMSEEPARSLKTEAAPELRARPHSEGATYRRLEDMPEISGPP